MTNTADQRRYQRCASAICKTAVSDDGRNWAAVELNDLSAGGLKFRTNIAFKRDAKLLFTLSLYNMLSEFNLKLEGRVIREDSENGTRVYAVQFHNISKYDQVQLDEIVKSRISLKAQDGGAPLFEDGTYSFLFLPRARSRKSRLYK